ncbi:MAG: hypothetical protein AAFZ91_07145 [Pseudomonadota bacterium]
MRFLRALGAWFAGGVAGYIAAALASQAVVLAGLAQLGLGISLADGAGSLSHAVLNMPFYLIVILLGFAIAFFIARQVKRVAPASIHAIAYPLAGATAIAAALGLMHRQFGVFPILGAQETYGLILQIAAGAVGGFVFEALRPKAELSSAE